MRVYTQLLITALSLASVQSAQLPTFMLGTYELVSSENYENFLAGLGLGWIQRQFLVGSKPVQRISENEKGIRLVVDLGFTKIDSQFQLNVPYTEVAESRQIPTVASLDGNRLTKVKKQENKEVIEERQFLNGGNTMRLILSIRGQPEATSTRIFRKKSSY